MFNFGTEVIPLHHICLFSLSSEMASFDCYIYKKLTFNALNCCLKITCDFH